MISTPDPREGSPLHYDITPQDPTTWRQLALEMIAYLGAGPADSDPVKRAAAMRRFSTLAVAIREATDSAMNYPPGGQGQVIRLPLYRMTPDSPRGAA